MGKKQNTGLYVPQLEKDACGIGLIANLNGVSSQQLVSDGLTILENMEHRGASGSEPNTGDGAGILLHVPYVFLAQKCLELGFSLPEPGNYGVGNFFFPRNKKDYDDCNKIIKECATDLDFKILGSRPVPVRNIELGKTALLTEPYIEQLYFSYPEKLNPKDFDRKLYVLRQHIAHSIHDFKKDLEDDFYITSLSSRIIVYKGQLTSKQVRTYYPELSDPLFKSAIALIHSRFSTNTIPKWKLAQPFKFISHNGEINTIQGNINWWKAKSKALESKVFTEKEFKLLFPVVSEGNSDSANFDSVLEFLVHSGRTIPHALMMMIPEAWQNNAQLNPDKKYFYEYHEALMEPWDGPASICFTDGTLVGATLDRNGLRPSRYIITDDNVLILASETGVLPVDPSKILIKERLEPGKILIADLEEHRIIEDEELKEVICSKHNYEQWVHDSRCKMDSNLINIVSEPTSNLPLNVKQVANGFSKEDEELILQSMSEDAKEPIGSMGSDIPLAVLSKNAQHISNYFKQQFAQVTNPPIDPLRESDFMTLETHLGGSENILETEKNLAKYIRIKSPVLNNAEFSKLQNDVFAGFKSFSLNASFPISDKKNRLKKAIKSLGKKAIQAVSEGYKILLISNVTIDENRVPIPSLLITGAIHHALIQSGLRHKCALVVDGNDLIETHHIATLISYGADAVFPRLAYETVHKLYDDKHLQNGTSFLQAAKNYKKALEKGLLKIMSKLGISTVLSYKGAQTFEALGIASEVIDTCFEGTISRIEGMTFEMLEKEALIKHRAAFSIFNGNNSLLPDLGVYQWKRRGEFHLFNPKSVHLLQYSTRMNDYELYKKFTKEIDEQEDNFCTLRSLFEFTDRTSIPLNEVEPVESILTRFVTGAMSFGSISYEAHTALAIAMNRIGGKSNSGEGGEDEIRYPKKSNGDWERSAIKQVASGRFGVTINYLTNAVELQIKMAQGAKPGEGGQLPGHKVNNWIARVRHSTPSVGLISPPPHHDIYSIEDLAQLIFDLKNANRKAKISVKLVSKAGVGIIASGVTKGHADHILISGFDGGTGASPLSSIRHAGLPWELGLAETHQVLMRNKLRDRVRLQVDGQIRTGRDLAIATLLGAEEWGISTAALVVEGCILMRKCHLNTCPVGIATQNEELRKKFNGKVEHLVNYFHFLAEDLREIMAELGFSTINEMVGQSQKLTVKKNNNFWKLQNLDLSPIFYKEEMVDECDQYQSKEQDHQLENVLDRKLISHTKTALGHKVAVKNKYNIKNTDRAVGTMLSNELAKLHGSEGLPDDSIRFTFKGSAGQSFCAFGIKGLTFTLEGDTNDYFGKGLSGAKLIMKPHQDSNLEPHHNVIVGNVALYGATSGEAYIKGKAGERFCVRNSGAIAVAEGVGAHGCEYMTGGRVVVLGDVGRNFAAGMSGGIAYVFDPKDKLEGMCNQEMVDLEYLEKEDFIELRNLIDNHFRYTNSERAAELLQNWNQSKFQFVKVFPKEYKAALQKTNSLKTITKSVRKPILKQIKRGR